MRRRVIEDRVVYEGFRRVRRIALAIERGDGAIVRVDREVVEARDAAAILPFDPERGVVLLVRQFRPAPFLMDQKDDFVEVCAGLIDPGETPEACALREAREETGLVMAAARCVGRIYPSPGVCTERITLFLATYDLNTRVAAGGGLEDEGEDIDPFEISLPQALAMIETGDIVDAKTIILLQRLAAERGAR